MASCGTCRHQYPREIEGVAYGECRRYPPSAQFMARVNPLDPKHPQMTLESNFPPVADTSYCGEFELRIGASDKAN